MPPRRRLTDETRAIKLKEQSGLVAIMRTTGGAGAAETEDIFRIARLMEAVEAEGATFFDHNRPPFVSVELELGARASETCLLAP